MEGGEVGPWFKALTASGQYMLSVGNYKILTPASFLFAVVLATFALTMYRVNPN